MIPPLVDEGQELVGDVPTYIEDGLSWLRDNQGWLYDQVLTWGEDFANTDTMISDEPAEEAPTNGTSGSLDTGSPAQEIAVDAGVEADEAIGPTSGSEGSLAHRRLSRSWRSTS